MYSFLSCSQISTSNLVLLQCFVYYSLLLLTLPCFSTASLKFLPPVLLSFRSSTTSKILELQIQYFISPPLPKYFRHCFNFSPEIRKPLKTNFPNQEIKYCINLTLNTFRLPLWKMVAFNNCSP